MSERINTIGHALLACSWMPHWSCHYYRLETNSSFTVGDWEYSVVASVVSLILYGLLIAGNLASVAFDRPRVIVATVSGIGHATLLCLHIVRLIRPFRFEVFGFTWSRNSSLREVALIVPFVVLASYLALRYRNAKFTPTQRA